MGEEENVDRPMINNNETKLKSHLEIIQANKRKKKEIPSLSLDDKTLYDIYEKGTSCINGTFTSKNKINFQRNFNNLNDTRNNSKDLNINKKQNYFQNNNESQQNNFQNIYVNNINIMNNFNNFTLNTTNVNTVLIDNTKEIPFFLKKKYENDNLNSFSTFTDISNFTYSKKPSIKIMKNNSYAENSTNSVKQFQYVENNTNTNFKNNFSNFNNLNSKTNLVNKNIRNSLNLNSSSRIDLTFRKDSDPLQNKLISKNKILGESGELKEISDISDNNILLDNSNIVNVEFSNSKNFSNNFIFNNSNNKFNLSNTNTTNIFNNNLAISDNSAFPINKINSSSINIEGNNSYTNSSKTRMTVSNLSENNRNNLSNNIISLKLIPNIRKVSSYENRNVEVKNSPSKNSIFLNFLDKSKNMQINNNSNINTNCSNNNISNSYYHNLDNESFRNQNILNDTNLSSNRIYFQLNKSLNENQKNIKQNFSYKNNKSINDIDNYDLKNQQSLNDDSLNNNYNNPYNNLIRGNSDNLYIENFSPTKRNSQPICFSTNASKKNEPNQRQIPEQIKLQITSKIGDKNNKNDLPNLEIIKRLSGDDEKDIFGD